MASAAQQLANQANAKKSTGPSTPEGRATSASNSLRHGLTAASATLFAAKPEEREQYLKLQTTLREECLPSGTTENLIFEQYTYASFQCLRAQSIECETQDRWLENPDSQQAFLQMERAIKLGALFERRAAKAFKQLQQLLLHRLAGVEVHAELSGAKVFAPVSVAIPFADLRKDQLAKEEPLILGLAIATGHQSDFNRADQVWLNEANVASQSNSTQEQSASNSNVSHG